MSIVQELFADVFGSHIGKHSERLIYAKGKTVLAQAPLMHLKQVIVASRGVSISADAIAECCERGIPIFFLNSIGEPVASLYAPGLGGTVLTRRAQLASYYDPRGVAISLAIADAKINNQAATLKYVAKSRKESDPDSYALLRDAAIEAASQADKLPRLRDMALDDLRAHLMAFEANAATHYWGALRRVIPDMYGWTERITRGATDPVNSLLNYGYGVLRTRVESALHLAGLDSFAGFIHADRPGKPSLTLDMMEEFRSVGVDRLVIGLVNRRFTVEMTENGRLQDDVRRSFAGKMREHLQATVRYDGDRVPIATVIQKQARRLAAYLRGETESYAPYRAEW
ncbi:MAG: CRISPR-associated endonuclease Cas1 [Anaerolineae bacterium]|nr:CRISPR-associated endonuclease Cas1 [Anaerolineae bacterium]